MGQKRKRLYQAFVIISLLAAASVRAQTSYYVDDDNCPGPGSGFVFDPFCKIQAAIDASSNGDDVVVMDGSYDIVGFNQNTLVRRLYLGNPAVHITIRCDTGATCTIDCAGAPAPNQCRAFDILNGGTSGTIIIDGFNITGGYIELDTDSGGGAIRSRKSQTIVKNCNVYGNYAKRGGAMMFKGDFLVVPNYNPKLENCVIRDNHAMDTGGGGIYCAEHADVDITDCQILANTANSNGGGIWWHDGADPKIERTVIAANEASRRGGGLFGAGKATDPSRPWTCEQCIIVGNWTNTQDGGGIAVGDQGVNENVRLLLVNSVVAGNEGRGAGSNGGGLAVHSSTDPNTDAQIRVVNTLFAGNFAREGGAIYMVDRIDNVPQYRGFLDCTIVENVAVVGGAIRHSTSSPANETAIRIHNTIVWKNKPFAGQIVESFNDPTTPPGFEIAYSDVTGVQAQDWDAGGNISLDPLYVGGSNGNWSAASTYDSISVKTTFYDDSASWSTNELMGNLLEFKTPFYLQAVVDSNTSTSVTVWGDFSAPSGSPYFIKDYHLTGSSPCIDAADNTRVPEDETDLDNDSDILERTPVDLDMIVRFIDDPNTIDTGVADLPSYPDFVDMGAFEFFECTVDDDCVDPLDPCDGYAVCVAEFCEIAFLFDCNENNVEDMCDILGSTSDDCNANGIPDECGEGDPDAVLTDSVYACDDTLTRTQNHVLRFTFACDNITIPLAGEVEIRELLPNGMFDTIDLSGSFTFTIENGITLRVEETTPVLANETWYAVLNTGGWLGVAEFEMDYVVVRGDANNTGFTNFADLAAINANFKDPAPDDDRYDIDANAVVEFADLTAANAFIPSQEGDKPSGHGCTLP